MDIALLSLGLFGVALNTFIAGYHVRGGTAGWAVWHTLCGVGSAVVVVVCQ